MGLRRNRLVPLRERRKASWWTTVGITSLGLAGTAIVKLRSHSDVRDIEVVASTRRMLEMHHRRLSDCNDDVDEADWMYPNDLLLENKDDDPKYSEANNKHWLFIHVILMGYMILGLNTVCDIYFTGALDVMVDRWNIKPDVAGATFMAAGGSAPELFTSLIGAVISQSDVGFGTIVGSAVFNVLFVIGLCGWSAKTPIDLSWWPLFRDCSYYIFGLSILAAFARTDRRIDWWEALILFLCYIFYCILMYFNETLESYVKGTPVQVSDEDDGKASSHVIQITDCEDEQAARAPSKDVVLKQARSVEAVPGPPEHHIGRTENNSENPMSSASSKTPSNHEKHHIRKPYFDHAHSHNPHHPHHPETPTTPRGGSQDGTASKTSTQGGIKVSHHDEVDDVKAEETAVEKDAMDEDEMSEEPDDIEEMMTRPEERLELVMWIMKLPIYAPLYYLTPKPTERCFIATFLCSLMWIAGYSFFLVWWIEILCNVLEIESIIAGLTVLAASTSIPDLVSSMAVARAGEGDMAVSSSIGSNIFDIMVGLPVPWMIKILVVEGMVNGCGTAQGVKVGSPYIVLYVLLLLFMVFCVILSIHVLQWKLTRALGLCMAVLYVLFLTIALSVELGKPEWLKV
mmetsp:Transcript_17645/g.40856  ORF Transcript_17645/g.40856 Transcript_17645/m.40856 type:complete len:628 (-) Transcript_17645:157-2040(-)